MAGHGQVQVPWSYRTGVPQNLTIPHVRGITSAAPCLFRSTRMNEEDAMVIADVSFGDIFWSVLWFFFLFIWIMVLFHVLTDLFRDHSLSGVAKTLWVLFLV